MRKLVVFILFAFVILILSACQTQPEEYRIPSSTEFVQENNADYVGSYYIDRSNLGQEWSEWGEWTRAEHLLTLGGPEVCFGYNGHDGTFRAAEGYHWKPIKSDGRTCLKLEKK